MTIIKPAYAGNTDLFSNVSTADTGTRSDYDFYETLGWQVRSLMTFAPDIAGKTVLECCSGRDAITSILRDEYGCAVYTNDIDDRHPAQTHWDVTSDRYWSNIAPEVDWVVSNTPYIPAFEIVTRAVKHAKIGAAFLLRKTWAEPTEDRGAWLFEHTATREVRQPRAKFRGRGSDSCACDWMIWDRDGVTRRTYTDHMAKTRTGR